jgi:membrane fusion protein, heavy metal efflux system
MTITRTLAVLLAALLVLVGAGGAWLVMRATPSRTAPPPATGRSPGSTAALADGGDEVVVTLGDEGVSRAGSDIEPVGGSETAGGVKIPGTVEANAYRRVRVTPIVEGRVTRVTAALGDRVRPGQTLAEIYSPELAEAQTAYLSFVAEFDAAHEQLRRTERLVEIGAASRQELEQARAEHTAHATHVESTRAKLTLLGMSAEQVQRLSTGQEISSSVSVPAPIDGVVLEREANPGLNVEPSTPLFTIADLSTVWVVGELYESDFRHVRVGAAASIAVAAYPDAALDGRVSYIDPQVNPATRTARLRVAVPNPRGELRLGMYAEMTIGGAASEGRRATGGAQPPTIARAAVQTIGDRHFVYVPAEGASGRFVEREVRLGRTDGERVEILGGVVAGERVVTKGSFSLRAERERLGLPRRGASSAPGVQRNRVVVSESGFEPSSVTVRPGTTRITFVRTTDNTCATEVTFPSLGITRDLPLNQPVDVEFTAADGATVAFTCGMNMFSGSVVAK